MSEKAAKADRKKEEFLYTITINVARDGGFSMEVPKGANIPLTLDVLMRASQKVLGTFVNTLQQQKAIQGLVKPAGGIPEGLLRRPQG
jgi:hypothetical protein